MKEKEDMGGMCSRGEERAEGKRRVDYKYKWVKMGHLYGLRGVDYSRGLRGTVRS